MSEVRAYAAVGRQCLVLLFVVVNRLRLVNEFTAEHMNEAMDKDPLRNAYNLATKNRPDERKQYVIVDMDKPQERPHGKGSDVDV